MGLRWAEFRGPQVKEKVARGEYPAGAKLYRAPVHDGQLMVIAGRTPEGHQAQVEHLRQLAGPDGQLLPGRTPTLEEVIEARQLLTQDRHLALLLPRVGEPRHRLLLLEVKGLPPPSS